MPDGGYVTTWTSEGQDGDGNGVYARRFGANGSPSGSEFLVNTAIATAADPVAMARAFAGAVTAGRLAFEAGLGGVGQLGQASSPQDALLGWLST